MTELKTDRDLVELLRQRVKHATSILVDLHDALDLGGSDLRLAVQVVARALLGVDTGQDTTADSPGPEIAERDYEWCVFLGSDNPNGLVARVTTYTQEQAEEALRLVLQTHGSHRMGVAYRTVTRSPWQVVDTQGGEPS